MEYITYNTHNCKTQRRHKRDSITAMILNRINTQQLSRHPMIREEFNETCKDYQINVTLENNKHSYFNTNSYTGNVEVRICEVH